MTPSPYCTIGPFFPFQFVDDCNDLTKFGSRRAGGQHIWLAGRVLEEGNVPTANSVLEIWQPDSNGIFRHPMDPRFPASDSGFFGWGRARTDREGRYRFRTVLPGASCEPDGTRRLPHANLMILAIGLTRRLVTSVFFEIASDPVLDCVPADRRERLVAKRDEGLDSEGLQGYRFDIILRGENETPFFVD